jgi:hypothetical protein
MAAGEARTQAIRFGRLSRASGRLDRARAEAAIRAVWRARRVVWARGLADAIEIVAGRESSPPRDAGVRRDWGGVRALGRGAELARVRGVAELDERLLVGARHTAASRVPGEERLAFRMSIPLATLVSQLGVEALTAERSALARPHAFASELARAGVLAVWFLEGGEALVVARPDLAVVDGRLHALDRPAARWQDEGLWFWHGCGFPSILRGGGANWVSRRCSPSGTSSGAGSSSR